MFPMFSGSVIWNKATECSGNDTKTGYHLWSQAHSIYIILESPPICQFVSYWSNSCLWGEVGGSGVVGAWSPSQLTLGKRYSMSWTGCQSAESFLVFFFFLISKFILRNQNLFSKGEFSFIWLVFFLWVSSFTVFSPLLCLLEVLFV